MISIRRYLYGQHANGQHGDTETVDRADPSVAAEALPASPDILPLYVGLLDHISNHLLVGDGAVDLRSRIGQARSKLLESLDEAEAREVDTSVRAILTRHAARAQESAQRSALEMQHIVGVLHQALGVVAGGGERAVSRLQKIQGALRRATGMHDMAGLRASLSDAVNMVEEEARKERETAAKDLAAFDSEVARARELVRGTATAGLPGRAEGVEAIREAMASDTPGEGLFLAAFVFSQLQGIVQRYGPAVVDELFLQLIRERIQPVARSTLAFRWTPFSLVSLVRGGPTADRVKEEITGLNRLPLVHKVSLGSRTAVLKVGLSHLLLDGHSRTSCSMVQELDGFTAAGAYRE
jgi:hypothetical protein